MADMVLEGIRVADWTIAHAGPKGAVWLAALGAEVIHIELAGTGDSQRGAWRTGASDALQRSMMDITTKVGDGLSSIFEIANFNKKSMTVNLKHEKGREIIYKLVEKCDVFTTNQLPDTIEKLGMDYDTLTKYNPQLIYCANSIMGYYGPYRLSPGFDTHGQATSGVMTTSGERGQTPMYSTWGIGDLTSAFAMFCGVVTALLYRERTGQGQRVDTSQMQSLVNVPVSTILSVYSLLSPEQRQANPYGGVCRAQPRDGGVDAWANCYRCGDGQWVQLGVSTEEELGRLLQAVGRSELMEAVRFGDAQGRMEANKELTQVLEGAFAQRGLKEWRERLKGHGVPHYPVNTIPGFMQDPQALANDMLITFDHPQLGRRTLPGMPFNLSQTPGRMLRAAPELGEHTEEVLLELGYTWDDILQFREQKVV